ncbi:hypothetical protein AMTR_s00009p00213050 [Amborella trichopoda]|uniref:Uncharacterized protein n=1 Tax=Amborella trichopoda TaxID=13333 RepID=W1NIB1_AMBTC|nr:hypothetical protein AMTR_s00009p00213050 [Amborella trichopoda]
MTRTSNLLRLSNWMSNLIVEDAIVILDDPKGSYALEVQGVLEDGVGVNIMGPSFSASREEIEKRIHVPSNSGRVIFTLPWFTRGDLVPEQLEVPFSTQIEGLNYVSADIVGREILTAIYHLLGRASLEELVRLPRCLEEAAKSLVAFGVSDALIS